MSLTFLRILSVFLNLHEMIMFIFNCTLTVALLNLRLHTKSCWQELFNLMDFMPLIPFLWSICHHIRLLFLQILLCFYLLVILFFLIPLVMLIIKALNWIVPILTFFGILDLAMVALLLYIKFYNTVMSKFLIRALFLFVILVAWENHINFLLLLISFHYCLFFSSWACFC